MKVFRSILFTGLVGGLIWSCESNPMQPHSQDQALVGARKDSVVVPSVPVDSSTCYICTKTRLYVSDTSSTVPYVLNKVIICGEKNVKEELEKGNYIETGTSPFGVPSRTDFKTTCVLYR